MNYTLKTIQSQSKANLRNRCVDSATATVVATGRGVDRGARLLRMLVELVLENGHEVLGIPLELKKELLLNLHEASSSIDPPEDWEGAAPDQLLLQLASAWKIEVQRFDK
ncbi:hypothetical protein Q3G72_002371 [Acer saccharum]|nr:hypothetical protein Q3G72_002371 [Acer saccharum]